MKKLFLLIVILYTYLNVKAFIPGPLLEKVFERLDEELVSRLDIYGNTTTHEQILKRGLVQSIVQYFYNQPNGTVRVNLTKATNEYYNLKKLYYDYYGLWFCHLDIEHLIETVLEPYVASVDLSYKTKNLPYAHFDAETFIESNNRVINFKKQIYSHLNMKNYVKARELAAQVLHAIQDFYSHSNWIEIGFTDINYDIGYANFSNQLIINANESNPCRYNCTMISVPCETFVNVIFKLIKLAGLPFDIKCKQVL